MGGDVTFKSEFGKGTTFFIKVITTLKVNLQDLYNLEKIEKENNFCD